MPSWVALSPRVLGLTLASHVGFRGGGYWVETGWFIEQKGKMDTRLRVGQERQSTQGPGVGAMSHLGVEQARVLWTSIDSILYTSD